jgi:hypothetical protein
MGITEKQALVFSLGVTLMVVVFLVGVFVIPIPMQEFKEEYGLNRIQEIRIEGTDVHFEIYGALLNTDRPDYIFPKDFLHYKIIFQTKKEFPIELHTELIIYAGKNNVTNTVTLPIAKFTSDERTNDVSFYYHAEELGRNIIFANFKFINSTNGVVLKDFSKTTKYDVVTSDYALQDKANKNTNVALIVSILIGVGTLIALISSTLYSRSNVMELRSQNSTLVKQNDELKKQYSFQNRPWIVINPLEFHLAVLDTREIPWKDYLKNVSMGPNFEVPKEVRLIVSCKNIGSSPARVIQYRYRGTEKITLEQLKQNKHSERILLPSQEMTWVVNTPYFGQEYFIAFLVEYSYDIFDQKGSDFIGTQWRYYNRDYWNIDEW